MSGTAARTLFAQQDRFWSLRGQGMLSAARCAWLGFVEANRLEAALIPLGGFLVLILFFLFQERMRRGARRAFQIVVTIFIIAGLGAIIYETLSPRECTASTDELNIRGRPAIE